MVKIYGIIGAMDKEIDYFLVELKNTKILKKASMKFYTGTLSNKRVVIIRSGVGKVNAAACTQALIDKFNPEAIICTGVAGSLTKNLGPGDTVISRDVIQHDVDSTIFGHKLGEIPNMGKIRFEASEPLIQIAKKVHMEYFKNSNVAVGTVLTGDKFIANSDEVLQLSRTFGGLCVEMEGGAIGHVCYLNNIPFLIIRSISDSADDNATEIYRDFVDKMAEKSYKMVVNILKRLE